MKYYKYIFHDQMKIVVAYNEDTNLEKVLHHFMGLNGIDPKFLDWHNPIKMVGTKSAEYAKDSEDYIEITEEEAFLLLI
jgi:hypothetical protein